MKKSRIILCIVVVFVIAIAAVAYVQRDNISAIIDGLRYTDEDLDNKLATSEESINEYMKESELAEMRPLTSAEVDALVSGRISQQDAAKIMTGETTLDQLVASADGGNGQGGVQGGNAQQNDNANEASTSQNSAIASGNGVNNENPGSSTQTGAQGNASSQPQTPAQQETQSKTEPDYNTLIGEKVAELYVVKAKFSSALAVMKKDAENEYDSYPKAERTEAKKLEIIKSKISGASALEKQCDAQVDTILAELRSLLTEAGKDTALADRINDAYREEKKVMKAKYVNKYF